MHVARRDEQVVFVRIGQVEVVRILRVQVRVAAVVVRSGGTRHERIEVVVRRPREPVAVRQVEPVVLPDLLREVYVRERAAIDAFVRRIHFGVIALQGRQFAAQPHL